MRIMFVCTGNTTRSAMAEAIFRNMDADAEVCSSGIMAESGKRSSKIAVEVCKSHGIDISAHRATYFKDSDIEDMDLVLTFERFHSEKIKIYYPNLDVCTIREFIGEYPSDINDPVGGEYKVYDACFLEIDRALKKVKSRLFS